MDVGEECNVHILHVIQCYMCRGRYAYSIH